MCYQSEEICRAVYSGIPKGVPVFGLAGTVQEKVAAELGIPFFAEAYGDVKYTNEGTLVIDRKKKYEAPSLCLRLSKPFVLISPLP